MWKSRKWKAKSFENNQDISDELKKYKNKHKSEELSTKLKEIDKQEIEKGKRSSWNNLVFHSKQNINVKNETYKKVASILPIRPACPCVPIRSLTTGLTRDSNSADIPVAPILPIRPVCPCVPSGTWQPI